MEICLKLKHYCIETAAKKEYEKMVNGYFKNGHSDSDKFVVEAKIEALKFFLEQADFRQLRGTYNDLGGSNELKVKLKIPENHSKTEIVFNNMAIKPYC